MRKRSLFSLLFLAIVATQAKIIARIQRDAVSNFSEWLQQMSGALKSVRRMLFLTFASLHLSVFAQSQSGFWRDETGKPVNETESMKSRNGFGGALLVTTDEDWEQKWNTPPETRPSFTKAEVVPYGKKIFILSFFSNPKLDASGAANVRCDYTVLSPKGNATLVQKDMSCFVGKIAGDLFNMYLSAPVIAFSGDSSDPAGTWVVEVMLRDGVRGTELPLRGSFDLK